MKATTKEQAAEKIRSLGPGGQFTVRTNQERVVVLNMASSLRAAGLLGFKVHTQKNPGGGFTVSRIG